MKRIKAVVFDMDGTLFDTENIAKASWNEGAKQFGFKIDEDFHDQLIGLPKGAYCQVIEDTLPKDLDQEAFDSFRIEYFKNYLSTYGMPIKEGMWELLDFLKDQRISIALATSTWRERVEEYFTYVPIKDYFSVIVCGDEVKQGKPHPLIYQEACRQLQVSTAQALAVEDSCNGVLSATQAGIDTIVVPDCVEPAYEILQRCLTRANSLLEVKTIIEHLLKEAK